MLIVLFRHGPAGERDASRWPDDAKRPLTPKGERRTLEAARGLGRLLPGHVHVLTSPLARAEQTARVLERVLKPERLKVTAALAPGVSYRRVIEELAALDSAECVVLVGHEPDLGKLAGVLVFGAPAALGLKKAGACSVEFVGTPAPGQGRLEWFLPPRLLRRLGTRATEKA
jgi:phosphohistidine phosphatase